VADSLKERYIKIKGGNKDFTKYVYHGYRMTIVMASKQDWGSLMERVAKVKVPGGKFI
jgi:hypothetical protein